MQIDNLSSGWITRTRQLLDVSAKNTAGAPSSVPVFSNMTPQQMASARSQLTQEGKITIHQSGQMAVMDGEALASANDGQLYAGSTNMYKMIDEAITEQKANGDQFNAKANVASYQSLQTILKDYDKSQQSSVSAVA